VQGASALQKTLDEHPGVPIRVLVVWERVLWTDWAAPSSSVLRHISDARALQFWDPSRALSTHILLADDRPAHHGSSQVVWDAVYVFPKGERWGDRFPAQSFANGPVVRVMPQFREALADVLAR
jgi:hypothetical protein